MSVHSAGSLHHALKQVAVTGATGSLLLGGAVAVLATGAPAVAAAPAVEPATTTAGSVGTITAVKLRTVPTAAHLRRKVNVKLEMKTAASLKGRPYRYGAAGPRAFDCSGYVQYVFKKQHWKLNRTAAAQYRQTKHVPKKRAHVGDLVFFYGSGGVYHVGIYAGNGRMWASPHTGSHVRKQKIYGSNWKVGRVA